MNRVTLPRKHFEKLRRLTWSQEIHRGRMESRKRLIWSRRPEKPRETRSGVFQRSILHEGEFDAQK